MLSEEKVGRRAKILRECDEVIKLMNKSNDSEELDRLQNYYNYLCSQLKEENASDENKSEEQQNQ